MKGSVDGRLETVTALALELLLLEVRSELVLLLVLSVRVHIRESRLRLRVPLLLNGSVHRTLKPHSHLQTLTDPTKRRRPPRPRRYVLPKTRWKRRTRAQGRTPCASNYGLTCLVKSHWAITPLHTSSYVQPKGAHGPKRTDAAHLVQRRLRTRPAQRNVAPAPPQPIAALSRESEPHITALNGGGVRGVGVVVVALEAVTLSARHTRSRGVGHGEWCIIRVGRTADMTVRA